MENRANKLVIFMGLIVLIICSCTSNKIEDKCKDLDFSINGLDILSSGCEYIGKPIESDANHHLRIEDDKEITIGLLSQKFELDKLTIKVDGVIQSSNTFSGLSEGMRKISLCHQELCVDKYLFVSKAKMVKKNSRPTQSSQSSNSANQQTKNQEVITSSSSQLSDIGLPADSRPPKPSSGGPWDFRIVDGKGRWVDLSSLKQSEKPLNSGTNSYSTEVTPRYIDNDKSNATITQQPADEDITQKPENTVVNPTIIESTTNNTTDNTSDNTTNNTTEKVPEYLSKKASLSMHQIQGCAGVLDNSKKIITLNLNPTKYIQLMRVKVKSTDFTECSITLNSEDGKDRSTINEKISNQDSGSELSLLDLNIKLRPNEKYTLTIQATKSILKNLKSCTPGSTSNSIVSLTGDTDFLFDLKFRH